MPLKISVELAAAVSAPSNFIINIALVSPSPSRVRDPAIDQALPIE